MKKRLLAMIGAGVLSAAVLCGCGSDEPASNRERISEKEKNDSDEEEVDEVNAPPADHVPEPAEDADENADEYDDEDENENAGSDLMPLYDADVDFNVAYVRPAEGFTYYGDPAPTGSMVFRDADENYVVINVDYQYDYWEEVLENGVHSVQGGFDYYTRVDSDNYAWIMVDLQCSYDYSPVYLAMEGTWDSDAVTFEEDGEYNLVFKCYEDTYVNILLSRSMVENWTFADYQGFFREWFPETGGYSD